MSPVKADSVLYYLTGKSQSYIDRYFWSEHGLAVMWKGHSYCRSHWESTPRSAAFCSFRPLLRRLYIIVARNKQYLWRLFNSLSFIQHISSTPSFAIISPFVFLSFLPLPVSSIHLYIFFPSRRVSISTSLSSHLFVCRAALAPYCRLAFLLVGTHSLQSAPFSSGQQHYRLPK